MDQPEDKNNQKESLLTSIRDTYTLSNTSEPEEGEDDPVLVNHFLSTLAEVALKVAARKISHEQAGKQNSSL